MPEIEAVSVNDEAYSGGAPLMGHVRDRMESLLGSDLGNVRVHTDERANVLSRAVNAVAFTIGHDIFFGKGAYDPGGPEGGRLLAHELTHVVQQEGAPTTGTLALGSPDDEYEQEAWRVAASIMNPYGTSSHADTGSGSSHLSGSHEPTQPRLRSPLSIQREGDADVPEDDLLGDENTNNESKDENEKKAEDDAVNTGRWTHGQIAEAGREAEEDFMHNKESFQEGMKFEAPTPPATDPDPADSDNDDFSNLPDVSSYPASDPATVEGSQGAEGATTYPLNTGVGGAPGGMVIPPVSDDAVPDNVPSDDAVPDNTPTPDEVSDPLVARFDSLRENFEDTGPDPDGLRERLASSDDATRNEAEQELIVLEQEAAERQEAAQGSEDDSNDDEYSDEYYDDPPQRKGRYKSGGGDEQQKGLERARNKAPEGRPSIKEGSEDNGPDDDETPWAGDKKRPDQRLIESGKKSDQRAEYERNQRYRRGR